MLLKSITEVTACVLSYVFFICSKFIQDKYKYDKQKASYIAGSVYDISMILSPFLGGIIVRFFFIKYIQYVKKYLFGLFEPVSHISTS